MKKKIIFAIIMFTLGITFTYAADLILSENVVYDNNTSGLNSTNVQDAIDEIYDKCGNNSSISEPVSFAEDSWETIISNVKAGNINAYNVGDTKEIELTGFTNEEEGSNGLYTIRIANVGMPYECYNAAFSQTACGFVIEFVDIITTQTMNPSATNVGGWKDSVMRTYVNDTIYNALSEKLRRNIIDTYVVSGHGSSETENFLTTDKIYLLSTKEVWGGVVANDAVSSQTRQLDYYKNVGVSLSGYSQVIKKYNGSSAYWSLRSANKVTNTAFSAVASGGQGSYFNANVAKGVAPAFRIG